MDRQETDPNPYQSPVSLATRGISWFRWSRVPYGLYCAYRGYVDQMRTDGGSALGHLVCWMGILFFGTISLTVSAFLLAGMLENLFTMLNR